MVRGGKWILILAGLVGVAVALRYAVGVEAERPGRALLPDPPREEAAPLAQPTPSASPQRRAPAERSIEEPGARRDVVVTSTRSSSGRTGVVRGTVTGEPLAGRLQVSLFDGSGRLIVSTAVDEDGSFELLDLEPGAERELQLHEWSTGRGALASRGWETGGTVQRAAAFGVAVRPDEITQVTLSPQPGALLAGCVLDSGGAPVPETRLVLWLSPSLSSGTSAVSARTDADGAFRCAELPAGGVHVSIEREGYARRDVALEPLAPGERREDVTITLDRGSTLAGFVLLPDGQPTRAEVRLVQGDGPDGEGRAEQTTTDAEGRFRFEHLTKAPCTVSAVADDALAPDEPHRRDRLTARADGVVPGPGELMLHLELGELLRGRALDEAGEPVSRFTLRVEPAGGAPEALGAERLVRTFESDDGRFELRGLHAGRWLVSARAPGFEDSAPVELHLPSGQPLDLRLATQLRLAGQVRLPDGRPAGRARVFAYEARDPPGHPRIVRADAEGRFQRLRLAPGTWRVHAELGALEGSVQLVTLQRGEEPRELALTLDHQGDPAFLVQRRGGASADGLRVELAGEPGTWSRTTDRDGTVEFEPPPPGRYELTVRDRAGELLHRERFDAAELLRGRVLLVD